MFGKFNFTYSLQIALEIICLTWTTFGAAKDNFTVNIWCIYKTSKRFDYSLMFC